MELLCVRVQFYLLQVEHGSQGCVCLGDKQMSSYPLDDEKVVCRAKDAGEVMLMTGADLKTSRGSQV